MKLSEFIKKSNFEVVNEGDNTDTELSKVFCCDLLSIVMSKNPANSVWVTVMGNMNSVAVCVLTEGGCIVLAEDISPDEVMLQKAKQQGVTVLKSSLPVFDTGLIAHNILNA